MTIHRAWRLVATGLFAFSLAFPTRAASPDTTARSKADRVNVRSRPGYRGEIVTQLKKGQTVVVLDTVTLKNPAADEPPTWLKIELPPNSPGWVLAEFLDADRKSVTADILNVRAGPSFEHGILARAKRGTPVKALDGVKDGWIRIAAPAGAVGFVPAAWIDSGAGAGPVPVPPPTNAVAGGRTNLPAPPTAVAAKGPIPAPSPRSVVAASAPAVSATNAPASTSVTRTPTNTPPTVVSGPVVTNTTTRSTPPPAVPAAATNGSPPSPATPAVHPIETPKTPPEAVAVPPADSRPEDRPTTARWVRREGVVVRPSNITAPSGFALRSKDRRKTINFLISTRAEPLNWREYHGRVVFVTGREYLDHRSYWNEIPVLDVETIEAVR